MRILAAGSAHATEVDALIADLRRARYRRPRLQQEFDRAPAVTQRPHSNSFRLPEARILYTTTIPLAQARPTSRA